MFFLISLLVFTGIIWWIFTRNRDNPLESLPGPPRKPFFGVALELMKVNPDTLFQIFIDYANQYGHCYVLKLMGLWLLSINNPADIEVVLSHTKNIKKSVPYKFLQPWLGTGLLLSTGNKWHKRRKILTQAFHFNILRSFFLVIEEKSRNLVSALRESKGKDVDILPILSYFTLYAICETAMGTQLDSDQSSTVFDYKNSITNIAHLLFYRFTRVWLHYDIIFKKTAVGKNFMKNLDTANTFAEKVIMERRKKHGLQNNKIEKEIESKERLALLDLLLEAERRREIDLEGIREEVNTFMFGGHDTTAVALTFCLMLLADHEDIQEKVYEECQCNAMTFCLMLLADHEDVQEKVYEECQNLFERCKGRPSMSDFSEMKYLEAVIKESLRLYPSAPLIGREVVEDFMMRDILVKKGTQISMNLYILHHRKDLYLEPEQFKPERFLNGEKRHPYAFLPFSAGPRNCIGQRYAMMEMKSFLYEIIRNFKLEPKTKGWRPNLMVVIVLRSLEPINVRFIPRVYK